MKEEISVGEKFRTFPCKNLSHRIYFRTLGMTEKEYNKKKRRQNGLQARWNKIWHGKYFRTFFNYTKATKISSFSVHQTRTGIWEGWETFRPLRGFFSLRLSVNRRLKKPVRGRNVSQPSHIPVLVWCFETSFFLFWTFFFSNDTWWQYSVILANVLV